MVGHDDLRRYRRYPALMARCSSPVAAASSARTSSRACCATAPRCACSTTSPPATARTSPTLGDEIELIEGDIQSYERVHNAVRGCELVFHQAALPSVPRSVQDPLTSNAANVIGTLNVLLAARDEGVRRVVFASSSSIYGASTDAAQARGRWRPCRSRPYAVAKLAAEGYCRAFHEVYGLETVALRYFNVFGPRQDPLSQYAAVIPRFILAFLARPPPGRSTATASSRATSPTSTTRSRRTCSPPSAEGVAGEAFNIACGERITLNELLDELRSLTGKSIEAVYDEGRAGDVQHSLADISARPRARSATSRRSTSRGPREGGRVVPLPRG